MPAVRVPVNRRSDPPHIDTPGAFLLQFGKFSGKTLSAVPHWYVSWLAEHHDWFEVREAARAFLDWDADDDEPDDGEEPDPQSAAVRLPLVVWEWEQTMTSVYGDDPATVEGAVVCQGRVVLRALCEKTTGRPFSIEEGGVNL